MSVDDWDDDYRADALMAGHARARRQADRLTPGVDRAAHVVEHGRRKRIEPTARSKPDPTAILDDDDGLEVEAPARGPAHGVRHGGGDILQWPGGPVNVPIGALQIVTDDHLPSGMVAVRGANSTLWVVVDIAKPTPDTSLGGTSVA